MAIPPAIRRHAPTALGALFAVSGAAHLLRPGLYHPLLPPDIPGRDALIVASGIAELICAAGLLTRRPWAGPASVALLLAIWPGNIWFAIDRSSDPSADPAAVALAWLRVPLQLPMMWAALQVASGRR